MNLEFTLFYTRGNLFAVIITSILLCLIYVQCVYHLHVKINLSISVHISSTHTEVAGKIKFSSIQKKYQN